MRRQNGAAQRKHDQYGWARRAGRAAEQQDKCRQRHERRDDSCMPQPAFEHLAQEHQDDNTVVGYAQKVVSEATDFVKQRNLVSVPAVPLEVIAMPEFKRGVAIAYCDSAGPLEKNPKTFFAVSPTPKDWTKEKKESFFRENNNYFIRDLTVHEAMPGHYLQLAHSNEFKAPTLVRAIFQSGSFIEGWAVYCEQMMAEQGYGGPEVKMQQLKMRLRAIANAILDQSIHAGNMTEQQAMDLMTKETFQEQGEATLKWKRARLTSAQLSTYFVGVSEHLDLRAAAQKKFGKDFDLKKYNDQVISYGSPPVKYVRELMGLLRRFIRNDMADLHRNGVHVRVIGDRDDLVHLWPHRRPRTDQPRPVGFDRRGLGPSVPPAPPLIAPAIGADQLDLVFSTPLSPPAQPTSPQVSQAFRNRPS